MKNMKIQLTDDQAHGVIVQQLKDFAERANAAHQLFINGDTQQAYKMMPYAHDAFENLEMFASESAKSP